MKIIITLIVLLAVSAISAILLYIAVPEEEDK